ncbi:MAG: HAMP domain-containing histidine kinase [Taibaiella sp.]|nr:HAMP domain-containing histidine kinase [Taibaiella sp.]
MIKQAADSIQVANTTLNNFAGILNDSNRAEKIAFAVGMASNRGKMRIFFDSDTSNKKQEKSSLNINRNLIAQEKIKFSPGDVKTIRHFDSLFSQKLAQEHLDIQYNIYRMKAADERQPGFTLSSTPFIINFYDPVVYRIDYTIPVTTVLYGIAPYLITSICVLLLAFGAGAYYYRSYRLQTQMTSFKESLFSNITHELKTPVSSLQLILDSAKTNNRTLSREHVSFAERELNRMKLLIDRILSFDKLSKEQFKLNKEKVNLDSIITNAIEIMQITLQQSAAVVHYEKGQKITAAGDKTLLINVLSALIDNAIKYCNQRPVIRIMLTQENNNALIRIRDNGIGIDTRYYKNVFEPFFRIPTGNIHTIKGHGLGLSFVKQVTMLHDGQIQLISSPGDGSTFTITIPL